MDIVAIVVELERQFGQHEPPRGKLLRDSEREKSNDNISQLLAFGLEDGTKAETLVDTEIRTKGK